MQMHGGQLEVTPEQVSRLVREQFPGWRGRAVTAVRSPGTVNALFRLGEDLVARFPLSPGDPADLRTQLENEADAARRLQAVSPFPTPEPLGIGSPGEDFPLPWSVYTWLPGTIAYDADVAASPAFAEDLARFVLALRAMPTEGRVFTGSWRGAALTSQDSDVAYHLEHSRGMIDTDALAKLWAELRTTPRTERDAWAHRDLMPGNLLVTDDSRLAGVIDVGEFTVADPAIDVQPAWNLFDDHGRITFREALGSDDPEWRRGMAWSFAQAIGCLWYYRETNPTMSRTAHQTLTALLSA